MTTRPGESGRLSTHKRRSVWYGETTAWPYRELTPEQVAQCRDAADTVESVEKEPRWQSMGPTKIAGRMTCAVAHPDDPTDILAGSAAGGVWRWKEGKWQVASDGLRSLNIGSLAVDRTDDKRPVVYCGTGEANLSADGHPGAGVFKRAPIGEAAGPAWRLRCRTRCRGA